MMSIWKKIRLKLNEMLKGAHTPHQVAMGFATGTFIAIIPSPGLNILLALVVSSIFKKISKVAIIAGLLMWNVFLSPVIYWASYEIGNFLFQRAPIVTLEVPWFTQMFHYTRRFLIGNLILSLLLSIVGYAIVFLAMNQRILKHGPSQVHKKQKFKY